MKPRPLLTSADIRIVERQLCSLWIGRGVRVAELESTMAEWVGASHAVAFGSGTAALTVALILTDAESVRIPAGVCDAVHAAVGAARMAEWKYARLKVSVYPKRGGDIEDFARHLPRRKTVKLRGRFGVFSFGALKDVTGGIGGCLVANEPLGNLEPWMRLSPLSDINAALILSQLSRYTGHTRLRQVADGKLWRSPA